VTRARLADGFTGSPGRGGAHDSDVPGAQEPAAGRQLQGFDRADGARIPRVASVAQSDNRALPAVA